MTIFKVLVQNIAGAGLGKERAGGNISALRIAIHNKKPDIVILTETRIEDRHFNGIGVFRGYKLTQHSSSGRRSGGVAVFVRKDLQEIDGTIRNSNSGHSTIGAYNWKGEKIVIGGIYGLSTGSDRQCAEIFSEYADWHIELTQRIGNAAEIVGGDFNVKMDIENNAKPRTYKIIKDLMEERDLIDAGGEEKIPTWRRPHLPKSRSRLDYILHSSRNVDRISFKVRWGRYDHAEVYSELDIGRKAYTKPLLKDWVLTTKEFLEQAPNMIQEVILDHDKHFRTRSYTERENFVGGRLPRDYEGEMEIVEKEEGIFNAHILMIIINKITTLQRRVQGEIISKSRREIEKINKEIGDTYKLADSLHGDDVREEEIKEKLTNLKTRLRDMTETIEQAKRTRIDNFYKDNMGKSKAASFTVTKEKRGNRNIGILREEDREYTDNEEILNRLQENYFSTVGRKFQPSKELEEFLMEHGVELPVLAEEDHIGLDVEFSKEEVKKAISSAKASTAPGPSGQTIAIFKYLYAEIPNILTRALNELTFVPRLIDAPAFAWLKERRIVFIPKPGKAGDRVSGLRPLSLLETLYKIKTRILTERMAGTMEKVLYADQHGFCRNRSIQTATIPILEAVNDAEMAGRPLQLLSIDLKAAFDTISPHVIYEVMRLENYPEIYTEALFQLTGGGRGRVYVNDMLGPLLDIESGNGQGNPPSASTFNIGSDPVLRATNVVTSNYRYRFQNGKKLPTTGFADDHLHGLSVRNAQQILDIIEVYRKFQEVSGLTVSLEKTSILGINTDINLMQEIEMMTGIKVVTNFRYLGVQIHASYARSKEASYAVVEEGIKAKCDKINTSFVDLFHKRQLIKTVVIPTYNHIFMAFGLSEAAGDRLDKKIIQLLWTKKVEGQVKQGRRLVAKNRLGASYEMGGMKMDFSKETANGLMLNILQKMKLQSDRPRNEQNFLYQLFEEKLREINSPNIKELFRIAGPKIWIRNGNKLKIRSPYFSQLCMAMANFMQLNEQHKQNWTTAYIAGHSATHDLFQISAADGITLDHYNITYVYQLFRRNDLNGGFHPDQDAEYPERLCQEHAGLVQKCKNLRDNLRRNARSGCGALGGFLQTVGDMKFSGLYRRMCREAADAQRPGPPSYFTRRKDGIPTPNLESFMMGYKKLFKMDIPSKTLENSYLIMNRQTWTNEKQYLSTVGRGEGHLRPNCRLCGRRENTLHLIFECEKYSEPLWNILEEAINQVHMEIEQGNVNVLRVRLHAFTVMYNMDLNIPRKLASTVMPLIQEIKRNIVFRRYKRETTAYIPHYSRNRIAGHLLITIQKLISLKKYQGKCSNILEMLRQCIMNVI